VGGLDPTEGAYEQSEVDGKLCEILSRYLGEARQKMDQLGQLGVQNPDIIHDEHEWRDAIASLTRRWRQIEEMLDTGFELMHSMQKKIEP